MFCFVDRQVTLFEEFMLLKEFEKRENSFANKVNTKLSEKDEMQEKVREIPSENVRKVDCGQVDWLNALTYHMSGDSGAIGANLFFFFVFQLQRESSVEAFFVSSSDLEVRVDIRVMNRGQWTTKSKLTPIYYASCPTHQYKTK